MKPLLAEVEAPTSDPIELAEHLAFSQGWPYDRLSEEEFVAEIPTTWCALRLWLQWQGAMNALVFSCGFDAKVPASAKPAIYELLALVNERLLLGRFDLCHEDSIVGFQYTLLLHPDHGATAAQVETVIQTMTEECERFYPALQSVVWSGNTPRDALEIALFETAGEA